MWGREVKILGLYSQVYSPAEGRIINQENPNESLDAFTYTSFGGSKELILAYSKSIFSKRKREKVELKVPAEGTFVDVDGGYVSEVDRVEVSLTLYSGQFSAAELSELSYNDLSNKAQKYKWYAEEEKIYINIERGWSNYDISSGIPGLEQVIESDDDVIIISLKCVNPLNSIQIYGSYSINFSLTLYEYSLAPVLQNPSPSNVKVYTNKPQIFTWEYEGDGSEQKSYEIGWSSDNGTTWNSEEVISSTKEHLYPKDTFPEAMIRWRVKATNEDGTSGDYLESEFLSVIQRPVVTVDFPNGINILNEKEQIFTWNYSGEDLEQKNYEIGWSSDNGITWNSEEVESSNTFHVFSTETFPTGEILWRIRATNSDGYVGEYDYGTFESVGQSEAPEIQSVSQDAIPTIIWTASNQEAFEICIKGENIDYNSGLIAGTETRSFQPNLMLADGIYEIRIRILNTYGVYSEWGATSIVLETEKPPYPPVLLLKENNLYGVKLSGYNSSGRGFYVRKGSGVNQDIIISECMKGESFVDCNLQPGHEYTYVFREYSVGYVDSVEKKFKCEFTGVVFHDVKNLEDMVHIKLSEDEYVSVDATLGKNVAYKQTIGREFPIKESDECKTERIVVTGFLNTEQYLRAYELFYLGKKVLFRDKNHCCHADIYDFQKREYFEMGYIVTITFERLDRSEEVELI